MTDAPPCIFCMIVRGEAGAVPIYEDSEILAFMDVMPQSDGHVLVIPKQHAAEIFEIDSNAAAALMRVTHRLAQAVRDTLQPDGLMIAQLNGAEAGQTVFHVHFHIVPRYAGQKLRLHARDMADMDELAKIGARIKTAL